MAYLLAERRTLRFADVATSSLFGCSSREKQGVDALGYHFDLRKRKTMKYVKVNGAVHGNLEKKGHEQ